MLNNKRKCVIHEIRDDHTYKLLKLRKKKKEKRKKKKKGKKKEKGKVKRIS